MSTEMVVEKLRELADAVDAKAREARDGGDLLLAAALFADRDLLDRAANLLQRG